MANREIPPLYGWPAPSEIPQYVLNIIGEDRLDDNNYAIVFLKICSFTMAIFACYKVISILKLYIWIAQHIGGWVRWSEPFYPNNIIVFIMILCGGGSILALKIPSFDENDPTLHILQLPILVTLIFVLLGVQSGIKAEIEENYDIDANGKFTKTTRITQAMVKKARSYSPVMPQMHSNRDHPSSLAPLRYNNTHHVKKRATSNFGKLNIPRHVTVPSFHAEQITQF